MTSETIMQVLMVYPDARCIFCEKSDVWCVVKTHLGGTIGEGDTQPEAWDDAASRLTESTKELPSSPAGEMGSAMSRYEGLDILGNPIFAALEPVPPEVAADRFTCGDEREVEIRTQRIVAYLYTTSKVHREFVRNELLDLMDHSAKRASRIPPAPESAAAKIPSYNDFLRKYYPATAQELMRVCARCGIGCCTVICPDCGVATPSDSAPAKTPNSAKLVAELVDALRAARSLIHISYGIGQGDVRRYDLTKLRARQDEIETQINAAIARAERKEGEAKHV